MWHSLRLGLAALIAAIAAPAQAETPAPIELTGFVQLERVTTDASGERRVERVDPDVVVPGDRLIFGTRFANKGTVPIERFVVSNPIPATVKVSAEIDPAMLVSVDGGTVWGALGALEVVDGGGQRRAAQPADITHVRWVLPEIAPGQTGQLEFPVTVR